VQISQAIRNLAINLESQMTDKDNKDMKNKNNEETSASSSDDGASSGGMKYDEMRQNESADKDEREWQMGEPMANDVTAIYDIPVQISAVLGRSSMQVSQLLKLGRGAVVELDRKVGEAIDIYVNNRLVARGEVVVVEDKLGVTMTEIVKSDKG
jgi:flagellar motor switch protein FliN/FliY